MKKYLALAGLTVVLAGCGAGITAGGDLGIDTQSLNLTSAYTTSDGTPIICDDADTPMEFTFQYYGDLNAVKLSLVGDTYNGHQAINVTKANFDGSNGLVDFTVPAGTAPLSVKNGAPLTAQSVTKTTVKPQAIIVSPAVIGSAHIEMVGYNSAGDYTRTISSNSLSIVSNCQ